MTDLFATPVLPADAFRTSRLSIVPVKGDAMMPTLRGDWDYVMAAPVKHFLYDALYVVDIDGAPIIYRCQSKMGSLISLIVDNPAYGSTPAARSHDVPRDWFEENVLGIVVCELKVKDSSLMAQAWEGGL